MYYCITCQQPMVTVDHPPQKDGSQIRGICCNNPYCALSILGFCNTLRFTSKPFEDFKSTSYCLYFIDSFNPTTLFLLDGGINGSHTSLVKITHLDSSHNDGIDAWETKLVLLTSFIPIPTDLENLFINSWNIYQRLKKLIPFS